MKAIFLIFHGLNPANGISKKITYQVNALNACGVETKLCFLREIEDRKYRMIDSTILCDYGTGIKGKILKRIEYQSLIQYAHKHMIDFIYIRSDHNANPFTLWMAYKLRKLNIKVVMEIPTYPYDSEYKNLFRQRKIWVDKCFRNLLAKQINYIVTFSDDKTIFGKPTIQISNGIDFSQIKLKQATNNTNLELHLIGVAEIHYWHGYDRLIQGLVKYYDSNPTYKIYFHIVGEFFGEQEKNDILPLIQQSKLEKYILLHGKRYGEELDLLFEKADMAIGSLARHRCGITHIKTLKNREYAARGLSFIYSEFDNDFEEMPYIFKVPADETPINVESIINYFRKQSFIPSKIRNSISHLSWKEQMSIILNYLS